jgi:hypothetical protein
MRVEHGNSSTKLQKRHLPSIESMLQYNIKEEMHPLERESTQPNPRFRKLLLEAIDEALSSLGDSVKQAIYFHLEKTFNLKKQEIPDKIEEFTKALEEIFGLGAKLLEIRIIKDFYEKDGQMFKYFPEKDELSFAKYMVAARLSNNPQ